MGLQLEWRPLPQGMLAFDRLHGVPIAGIGQSFMRPWIYPLYTPGGYQVLQEFAFDHPFHNGCFIGWHPVRYDGVDHNFWATPPARSAPDPMMTNLGRIEAISPPSLTAAPDFLTAELALRWRSETGAVLAEELRSLRFWATGCGHGIDLRSQLRAVNHPLELPATKFAGIGIRLDPRLTPACGGWFEGSAGKGCAAALHDRPGDFLRVEANVGDRAFGLYLEAPGFGLPWFVRDYGLILLNPVWHDGRHLLRDEPLVMRLTMVAYDAAATPAIDELSRLACIPG